MTALDTSEPSTNIPLQPPPKTPAKAAGFSPVISIIGIILTSLVLFFGGYFYLQYLQSQDIEKTQQTQEEERKKEEVRLIQIEENTKNDQKRKLDVANLEKGLADYFQSKKKYPEKLEELTPDYLIIIPLDPVTKGPYDYVPDEKFEKYTLSVKLSNGTNYSVNSEE